MANLENGCSNICQTWPILNEQLDAKLKEVNDEVAKAKEHERQLLQQTHESDGIFISTGEVADAHFKAEMDTQIIESLRENMKIRMSTCNGSSCELAKYCVRAVIVDEVELMI